MNTAITSKRRAHPKAVALFAGMICLGSLLILIPMAVLCCGTQLRDNGALTTAGSVPRAAWYLRAGQWQADARSVVAALRYWLQEDTPGQPSESVDAIAVAAPTNSRPVVPKA